MQITFASKTIQRHCEEEKHPLQQLGAKRAKRLKHRLSELGFSYIDERFEEIYHFFLELADTKSEVTDEDLYELVKR